MNMHTINAHGFLTSIIIIILIYIILKLLKKTALGHLAIFIAIEAFIWLIAVFFILFLLLSTGFLITTIMLLITVFLFGKTLKNILYGLFYKITGKIKKNQVIQIGDYQGKVTGFDIATVEITNDANQKIHIPYEELQEHTFIEIPQTPKITRHKEILSHEHIKEYINDIYYILKHSPYVIKNRPVHVSLVKPQTAIIEFYTFDEETAQVVIQQILDKIR